jgi:hypothetical protein
MAAWNVLPHSSGMALGLWDEIMLDETIQLLPGDTLLYLPMA